MKITLLPKYEKILNLPEISFEMQQKFHKKVNEQ